MKTLAVRTLVCLACSVVALATATAQTDQGQQGPPQRPQYLDLRYDEDWSHLKETNAPPDFFDPIKYILLNDRGWYMSLGGELRQRYDNWHDAFFGYAAAETLNDNLQRYLFHADTHLGEHVRIFTQLQSGLEFGKKGGPWYTDKDTAELHQAFVDFRSSANPRNYTLLRIGRQEIAFGTDHFISTGDFFNARRNFDGVTLTIGRDSWTWFAQATKPVLIKGGVFDDPPEHGRTCWGGGFFAPNPFTKKGRAVVFYTWLDTKHQLWQRGLGRDQRHTLDARIEGSQGGWDYAYESILQQLRVNQHLTYTLGYEHLTVGDFLKQTPPPVPPGKSVGYFVTWLTYKF
jgi:Alginate export